MLCELKTQIKEIIDKYSNPSESLIAILQEVQSLVGFISEDSVKCITELTGISSSKILGVASFYAGFRLKPIGKYRIMVCMGTACHVNGAERILKAICEELNIQDGGTTADGLFSLKTVACLGCCSLSPVMMINEDTYGSLTPDKVKQILRDIREKEGK